MFLQNVKESVPIMKELFTCVTIHKMLHVTLRSIRHKPEKMISLLPSSNAHVHKVINISVKTNCNTCRLAVHKETRDKVDCFMPLDILAAKHFSVSSQVV